MILESLTNLCCRFFKLAITEKINFIFRATRHSGHIRAKAEKLIFETLHFARFRDMEEK